MTEEVSREFLERSTRAAIAALRGLEQTAIMLETYAPDVFPEINAQGQKHFGRVMMEGAAQAIRDSWADAVKAVAGRDMTEPFTVATTARLAVRAVVDEVCSIAQWTIDRLPDEEREHVGPAAEILSVIREAIRCKNNSDGECGTRPEPPAATEGPST